MWKRLRIAALLVILAAVGAQAWFDRLHSSSWESPLRVAVFPLNGDGSDAAARYIAALGPDAFTDIERFLEREAHRYGLRLERPARVVLERPLAQLPPALGRRGGRLATILWSLRLRWYAWQASRELPGPAPQVRVFVLFHDPTTSPSVPHSLGLERGLIGVVYAFASQDMAGDNSLVVAHELMHTLGATDKYDPDTNAPLFPEGYGDPRRAPRYPQPTAEIMAGRRALSPSSAEMPPGLEDVVVGGATAREIGWTR